MKANTERSVRLIIYDVDRKQTNHISFPFSTAVEYMKYILSPLKSCTIELFRAQDCQGIKKLEANIMGDGVTLADYNVNDGDVIKLTHHDSIININGLDVKHYEPEFYCSRKFNPKVYAHIYGDYLARTKAMELCRIVGLINSLEFMIKLKSEVEERSLSVLRDAICIAPWNEEFQTWDENIEIAVWGVTRSDELSIRLVIPGMSFRSNTLYSITLGAKYTNIQREYRYLEILMSRLLYFLPPVLANVICQFIDADWKSGYGSKRSLTDHSNLYGLCPVSFFTEYNNNNDNYVKVKIRKQRSFMKSISLSTYEVEPSDFARAYFYIV